MCKFQAPTEYDKYVKIVYKNVYRIRQNRKVISNFSILQNEAKLKTIDNYYCRQNLINAINQGVSTT